jgi:flavin-dependent dehydrogenase
MNIVIAGGGTAGWLAAFYISKAQPTKHNITVIESSKIGIIGAGEGSTGSMIDLLNGSFFNYKVDLADFVEKTDATYKMGIRHQHWSPNVQEYFAPLDVSPTGFTLDDYIFKYGLHKHGNNNIHLCSKIGIEYEMKKYSPYALHFDGHKVGKYFKELCLADGVVCVDTEINDVIVENNNITSVITSSQEKITGDFFIDCTGFSRILMKKLGVEWQSYSEVLSVNTAMPFILKYEEGEEIVPETKATALSAGWMWNIPLSTRRGCGYVFDNRYISKEDAKLEVENYLQKEITPIKWISFDSGHSKEFWKNNVLCLGLASSFVEPLEATSIHNTIIQTAIFADEFLKENKDYTLKEVNQRMYNERISLLNRLTIDFISLHYQGGRDDTEFWADIKKKNKCTDYAKKIISLTQDHVPGMIIHEGMYGSFSVPLANWNLAGMGLIKKNTAYQNLIDKNKLELAEEHYNNFYRSIATARQAKSYIKYAR